MRDNIRMTPLGSNSKQMKKFRSIYNITIPYSTSSRCIFSFVLVWQGSEKFVLPSGRFARLVEWRFVSVGKLKLHKVFGSRFGYLWHHLVALSLCCKILTPIKRKRALTASGNVKECFGCVCVLNKKLSTDIHSNLASMSWLWLSETSELSPAPNCRALAKPLSGPQYCLKCGTWHMWLT